MTDLINDIRATARGLSDSIFYVCYEHKEPNLLGVILKHGFRYTIEEVEAVYASTL